MLQPEVCARLWKGLAEHSSEEQQKAALSTLLPLATNEGQFAVVVLQHHLDVEAVS